VAQAEADRATAVLNAAETRLAETQRAMASTRRKILALERRVAEIRARMTQRAVDAFETGPASTIEVLLSSGSITEFSDRLEFLGALAQSDADLVTEERSTTEQLRRTQDQLGQLADQQATASAAARAASERASSIVSGIAAEVDRLAAQYREQLHALQILGQRVIPGAAISVCPVRGPNSFVDSFGWPRPGGRIHEGIDMISPFGTPVVAVNDGNAVRDANPLGGNAVIVYHAGGTFTYYAHLSSYGASGQVSTGTVIGYVGSTGDAGSTNHLHFEYHPGGGPAVDPYGLLLAVC
jgi:murein DD-endopeptidase MepM/ murein hydrolase activator NlpD